jgi:hypothetical protein
LCRLDGLLDEAECAGLRAHAVGLLSEAQARVASGDAAFLDDFGPVMARTARYDLLLPLDAAVLGAARRVLGAGAPAASDGVGAAMGLLAGKDAALCELTTLVADPGAPAQPVHHDTANFGGAPLRVSLLVALQDVGEAMGPTLFWPRTHSPAWHVSFLERGEALEELLESAPHVRALLRAGDAVLYDTNVLHCGGANTSASSGGGNSPRKDGRRMLLALSAQEEDESNRNEHANIRPGYRGKLRLSHVDTWEEEPGGQAQQHDRPGSLRRGRSGRH